MHTTEFMEISEQLMVVHHRPPMADQIHPRPCEWLWTKCCGLIVEADTILAEPKPMGNPLETNNG